MDILSIDPGSKFTGYSVFTINENDTPYLVDTGLLITENRAISAEEWVRLLLERLKIKKFDRVYFEGPMKQGGFYKPFGLQIIRFETEAKKVLLKEGGRLRHVKPYKLYQFFGLVRKPLKDSFEDLALWDGQAIDIASKVLNAYHIESNGANIANSDVAISLLVFSYFWAHKQNYAPFAYGEYEDNIAKKED